MGHVIPLHGERHTAVSLLLPWYATGRIDAADRAMVEAHLAQCAECEAELRVERAIASRAAEHAPETDQNWAALLPQLRGAAPPARKMRVPVVSHLPEKRRWAWAQAGLGWAIAAQLMLVLLLGDRLAPGARGALYHALGSSPTGRTANVLVMFKPETRELRLRAALRASGATLVGGPTEADAYLLSVPSPRRDMALSRLRSDPSVTLAVPIGSDSP